MNDQQKEREAARPYMYATAFIMAIGAAMALAAMSGTEAYKACRAAGNSPFSCWVNE